MSVIYHYKLKNIKDPLPKGFNFIDPLTGVSYDTTDINIHDLIKKVNKHRPLPLKEDEAVELITASIIEQKPPQKVIDKYFMQAVSLPSPTQTLSFTRALVYDIYKKGYVSLLQRQSRAQRCLKCPFHTTRSAKLSIAPFINKAINKVVDYFSHISQSYPEEDKLGTCNVCGCPMKAKVKFSEKAVLAELDPDHIANIFRTLGSNAPSTCWMIDELSPVLSAKIKNSEYPQAQILLNEHLKAKALAVAAESKVKINIPRKKETAPVVEEKQDTAPTVEEKPKKKRRGRSKKVEDKVTEQDKVV